MRRSLLSTALGSFIPLPVMDDYLAGRVRAGMLIKLAERQSVEVEIVQHSEVLMNLGGVGCLLRYATPEQDL